MPNVATDPDVVKHVAVLRTQPDLRGVVAFATCTCGWHGANHPSIPNVETAKKRATDEMDQHLRSVGPGGVPPKP
jgi:hypothetical protein